MKNKIEIEGDIAKIWLNGKVGKGKYAIIDAEDVDKIKDKSWYLLMRYNGCYNIQKIPSGIRCCQKQKSYFLHRIIMDIDDSKIHIDHINGDIFDNRKCNLRTCSNAENLKNQTSLRKNKSSKFKGVCFNKQSKKWVSYIRVNYSRKHIGYFHDEIEAAKAYDKKAIELFGEFACTNKELGLY